MKPIFFSNSSKMRAWLEKNYKKEKELQVGFYKVRTRKPSITWSQSVDEALCFGWIDGIRRSIDEESYMIRFTPRNPNSTWSAVNIKKVHELIRLGKMKPEGLEAFAKREEKKSAIYAYEKKPIQLSEEFESIFKANLKAWEHYQSMAPSYRKTTSNWVMSAKQDTTQRKRLETLIKDSEEKSVIKPLSYGKKKTTAIKAIKNKKSK